MLVRLKDVATFHRGLTYKKTDEVLISSNIVLRANNIDLRTSKLNLNDLRYISESIEIPSSKIIRKNSILICTASGSKSHLGKVAFIDQDYRYAFGGFMGMLLPKGEDVDAGYLFKILTGFSFRELIASLTDGANINNLKFSLIEDFEFNLPSIKEQRQIVANLNAAFEKIDRAIQLTSQNVENVRALYNSTFQIQMGEAPGRDRILAEVCQISTKLVDPKEEPYLTQIHVGAANIKTGTGKLVDLKTAQEEKLISSKFPFDDDTVLYSKIRPYLMKVARPDFAGICSADVYPLTVTDELDKDYLFYLLLSPDFTQYAIAGSQRAGMPKVNREHLFAYSFNLPDKPHQRSIVQKLDSLLNLKNLAIEKYNKKLDYLSSLKQSVLSQSFSESDVK